MLWYKVNSKIPSMAFKIGLWRSRPVAFGRVAFVVYGVRDLWHSRHMALEVYGIRSCGVRAYGVR